MSENHKAQPESKAAQSSREILQAPVTSWSGAVLAGQNVNGHPVHARLHAELAKGVLILRGSVTSEEERSAVEPEAQQVRGSEAGPIKNELEIRAESKDLPGVLQQTSNRLFRGRV